MRVFAAASLTNALTELAEAWKAQSGDTVSLNFGASNLLARQIAEGAPADLFLSADEAKMDRLEKAKLLLAGTRRSLLSNTLAIVVPADSKLVITGAEGPRRPRRPGARAGRAADRPGRHLRQAVPAQARALEQGDRPGGADRERPRRAGRGRVGQRRRGDRLPRPTPRSRRRCASPSRCRRRRGRRSPTRSRCWRAPSSASAAKAFLDYLASAAAAEVFRRYGFLVPGSP